MNAVSLKPWAIGMLVTLGLALSWLVLTAKTKGYPAKARNLSQWSHGLTPFFKSGKFGYRDTAGDTRILPRFDGAEGFSDGRARVLVSGRFGFIDSSGDMVIPAQFYWASTFRGGYTSVWTGNNWDYLDKQGNNPDFPNR